MQQETPCQDKFSLEAQLDCVQEMVHKYATAKGEASRDAHRELRAIYDSHPFREVRALAGASLGYSPVSIWAHEHPKLAITAAAAAFVGAYAIYRNWDRIEDLIGSLF